MKESLRHVYVMLCVVIMNGHHIGNRPHNKIIYFFEHQELYSKVNIIGVVYVHVKLHFSSTSIPHH